MRRRPSGVERLPFSGLLRGVAPGRPEPVRGRRPVRPLPGQRVVRREGVRAGKLGGLLLPVRAGGERRKPGGRSGRPDL